MRILYGTKKKVMEKMNFNDVKKVMFAGKAILTFLSVPTQARFTFLIERFGQSTSNPEIEKNHPLGVKLLTGSNNTSDYTYMGTIFKDLNFRIKKNSRISVNAPSFKAFEYVYNKVLKGIEDTRIEIYHSGQCCRCGRILTKPESIKAGLGPECINIVGKLI